MSLSFFTFGTWTSTNRVMKGRMRGMKNTSENDRVKGRGKEACSYLQNHNILKTSFIPRETRIIRGSIGRLHLEGYSGLL